MRGRFSESDSGTEVIAMILCDMVPHIRLKDLHVNLLAAEHSLQHTRDVLQQVDVDLAHCAADMLGQIRQIAVGTDNVVSMRSSCCLCRDASNSVSGNLACESWHGRRTPAECHTSLSTLRKDILQLHADFLNLVLCTEIVHDYEWQQCAGTDKTVGIRNSQRALTHLHHAHARFVTAWRGTSTESTHA